MKTLKFIVVSLLMFSIVSCEKDYDVLNESLHKANLQSLTESEVEAKAGFFTFLCVLGMKYVLLILSSTLFLSGCIYNNNTHTIEPTNEGNRSLAHTGIELGVNFSSGDVGLVYKNQMMIMGGIFYPDQKDVIVLEGYGKGLLQDKKTFHIPGLYGEVIFSGINMIYSTIFSLSGLSNNSERTYKKNYEREHKRYNEEITLIDEAKELTTLSSYQKSALIQENHEFIDNKVFCTRQEDIHTIIDDTEEKNILGNTIYISYRDNGGVNNKISKLCFEKNNKIFEIERTAANYKKDIIESFTLF